jgi:hypothetical protein
MDEMRQTGMVFARPFREARFNKQRENRMSFLDMWMVGGVLLLIVLIVMRKRR